MVRRIAVTAQKQGRGAAYRTLRCIQCAARTEYCFLDGKGSVPVYGGSCSPAARIKSARVSAPSSVRLELPLTVDVPEELYPPP